MALEAVLSGIIEGGGFRAGEQLTEFGVRWIVELDATPLSSRFESQLDLIPLDGLRDTVFLVDSEAAVRALTDDGAAWAQDGTGFSGPSASTVLLREHSDPGWGDDENLEDWAMTLDASSGAVEFTPDAAKRNEARISFAVGLALVVGSVLLRRRQ